MYMRVLLSLSSQTQTVLSLICVAAAASYIGWRVARALRTTSNTSCGDCRQGPVTGLRQKPLVTLEVLSKSAGRVEADGGGAESIASKSTRD